jgi:hypothetical protein
LGGIEARRRAVPRRAFTLFLPFFVTMTKTFVEMTKLDDKAHHFAPIN